MPYLFQKKAKRGGKCRMVQFNWGKVKDMNREKDKAKGFLRLRRRLKCLII